MNYSKSLSQISRLLSASTLTIAITAIAPETAQAFSFTQVISFGDSLSDNGNLSRVTFGIIPPPPYVRGRVSNGPVWVEYLAQDLQIPLVDYAFGGATSGTRNTVENLLPVRLPSFIPRPPGLQQEISAFTRRTSTGDPSTLYTLWAGANDYLGGGVTDPQQPIANITQAVQRLINVGAKNILISNLPDLGLLPRTRSNSNSQVLSQLSNTHNTLLEGALALLQPTLAPDINLQILDVNSLFNQVLNNPGNFGFTNVTNSCLNFSLKPICSNQNQYLFWDDVHPTTAGHRQIANLALTTLRPAVTPESLGAKLYSTTMGDQQGANLALSTVRPAAVPEPTTIFGIAVSGLFMGGLKAAKRRRTKAEKPIDKVA